MGFLFLILYPGCFPFRLPPPPNIHLSQLISIHHFFNYLGQQPSFIYIFFKPPAAYISVKPPMSSTYVKDLCQPPSQTICCGALRGRRGTRSHEHSFCVAGVTRHLWHWVVPLHRINRAKHRGSFRSRRGNQKSFILVLRERCSAYGTGRE